MKVDRLSRAEIIEALYGRDGAACMYPGCSVALDLDAPEHINGNSNPLFVTIDHHYPQSWCFANGWTYEQTWDLSNLRLMHKKCNAKKGDLVPNPDGTLPEKYKKKSLKHRRAERAQRPEVCTACEAGRNLDYGEVCAACNSGPQPVRFPRWAKVRTSECDHELFWCAWCSIGVIPRASATEMIMLHGEGGEE